MHASGDSVEAAISKEELPGAAQAVVPLAKVTEYLLAEAHPAGHSKARFFIGLGFEISKPVILQEALVALASSSFVVRTEVTPQGSKYILDGYVTGPNGRSSSVRTVWIIESGSRGPRLITAYPGRQSGGAS